MYGWRRYAEAFESLIQPEASGHVALGELKHIEIPK